MCSAMRWVRLPQQRDSRWQARIARRGNMELLPYLRKLYSYDYWANREVAGALQAARQPVPRSARLLAHVVGAEWVWHSRLLPDSKKMAVWPQLTAEESAQEVEALRSAWEQY